MKMTNITFYLSLSILFVSNTFLLFKYKERVEEINLKDQIITENIVSGSYIDYLENALFNTLKIQGLKLNNISLASTDNKEIQLKDLIKENTLIYVYDQNACESCIHFGFNKLNKLIEETSSDNIIVLANSSFVKDLKIIKNMYDISVKIFKIEDELQTFKINVPYYVTVNKELLIENFFIPEKTASECCDKFLKFTSKKYLESKNERKNRSN